MLGAMTAKAKSWLSIRAMLASGLLFLASPGDAAESAPKTQGLVDVELPAIFAPITVQQRLESYAYITILLTPAGADKTFTIREKMPFLRDAFLRELNKGTIARSDDPKVVDIAAVKARLMARLNQILPPGTVSELKLEPIQYSVIQPQG
jgi:hypothetical protein